MASFAAARTGCDTFGDPVKYQRNGTASLALRRRNTSIRSRRSSVSSMSIAAASAGTVSAGISGSSVLSASRCSPLAARSSSTRTGTARAPDS